MSHNVTCHILGRLQDPEGHIERWANEERVTAPTKQGHLKDGGLDVLLDAISKITYGIAQVVLVESMFNVLWFSPDLEDEVFLC